MLWLLLLLSQIFISEFFLSEWFLYVLCGGCGCISTHACKDTSRSCITTSNAITDRILRLSEVTPDDNTLLITPAPALTLPFPSSSCSSSISSSSSSNNSHTMLLLLLLLSRTDEEGLLGLPPAAAADAGMVWAILSEGATGE